MYMMLLIQPRKISQGKGGVISRSVSTQWKFRVAEREVAMAKVVMIASQAAEKEDHEMVNAEEERRYRMGNSSGDSTETRVKSQKPGQFMWTWMVFVLCSKTHMDTKTVSHMMPMMHAMHSKPLTMLCDKEDAVLRPDT
jgi:hypothetical protein